MRDLAILTPRQLLYLWLCGLGLMPILFVGGLAVFGWTNHSQLVSVRRQSVLQAARDRTSDSSYLARHANDSAKGDILTAWKQPYWQRRVKWMSDSAVIARAAKNPADTAFTPGESSASAMGWGFAGVMVNGLCSIVAFGIPFALIGLTAWWGYKRRRGANAAGATPE